MSLVEAEGQWSRRGDIIDIFPVAAELPLRLEFFGDELEKMREFDPVSQRSLDKVQQVVLTPCQLNQGLGDSLGQEESDLSPSAQVGLAFDAPSSLLDYLPPRLSSFSTSRKPVRAIAIAGWSMWNRTSKAIAIAILT